MKQGWEDFRIAGAFLTVLPVARGITMEPQRLGRSMALFPAVGLALGLGLVVLHGLLAPVLPAAVLDLLLIILLVIVTGGLHLDGFADLIDGLAGGKDRQGMLRIMKDSRVGAMGAAGLILLLLLKYVSLHAVLPANKAAALIFFPVAGRWMQVMLAILCQYLRPEGGTGKAFVDHVGESEFLLGTATLVLAGLILFGFKGIPILLLLFGAAAVLKWYFEARLGGVTGDVLGAATETTEVATLLFILALF
jgi:adenosylcobinamide-GDP ribazoletransferase